MNIKSAGLAALAVLAIATDSTAAVAAPFDQRFADGAARQPVVGSPASSPIVFATKLTTAHGSLPIFRLTPSAAPTSFVGGALARSRALGFSKAGALGFEKTRLTARDERGVLEAYIDGVTGDAEIFPSLTASASGTSAHLGVSAQAVASAIFNRADIIPKDATQARLGAETPVFSDQVKRAATGATQPLSAPVKLFSYVSAQRFAAGLPVVGVGSHATVALGSDGEVRGLVRRWETAVPAGSIAATTTADQLETAIAAQLQPLQNRDTTITVNSVTPAYYDGNAKYLQPVYQFFATLHPKAGHVSNDHIVGYVPAGKLLEAIPVIGQHSGRAPVAPHPALKPGGKMHAQDDPSLISFGEYVNRDASMFDMSDSYVNGFASVPAWWYGRPIVRTQYYWAYPFEVESAANSYLNAVQVAYTQPHGDWWLNTTYSNWADLWYVNQIGVNGNPGYGAASGGQLATWIIDSCEVVPSFYDLDYSTGNGYTAFNYWWPVFQGLHRVLGFRTQMLLGMDNMNYAIASDLAQGANVNSAWFNEIANANFDQYGTYPDYHLGNLQVRYDRASIMYDTRNGGESIYDVGAQSAAGQLTNVWMGN